MFLSDAPEEGDEQETRSARGVAYGIPSHLMHPRLLIKVTTQSVQAYFRLLMSSTATIPIQTTR